MKYTLTMDERHFAVLGRAVESYMRLQMNQPEMLSEDWCWELNTGETFEQDIQRRNDCGQVIQAAYRIAHPNYYGAYQKDAFTLLLEDFYEVIKHQEWKDNPNRSEVDVHAGPVMKWGDGEMPRIERNDE